MEVGRDCVQRKRTVCDQGKTLVFWMVAASEVVPSKKRGGYLGAFHQRPQRKSSDGFFDLLISPLEGRGCKVQTPASMSAISMSFLAMRNQQPRGLCKFLRTSPMLVFHKCYCCDWKWHQCCKELYFLDGRGLNGGGIKGQCVCTTGQTVIDMHSCASQAVQIPTLPRHSLPLGWKEGRVSRCILSGKGAGHIPSSPSGTGQKAHISPGVGGFEGCSWLNHTLTDAKTCIIFGWKF